MTTELSIVDTEELEKYFHLITAQIGPFPFHLESSLSIGVEVFTLAEGFGLSSRSLQKLWRHSVRTGYLAALIANHQQVDQCSVWQAFVGGLLHDIGIMIFLAQHPQVFMAVADLAQSRGEELDTLEKNILGSTHGESGAQFLSHWGVPLEIQTIVSFHDQPFRVPHSSFCALTAVFIANVLEGGGIAQDADGVIGREGEAYLLSLGIWDDLPRWQEWVREISLLSV